MKERHGKVLIVDDIKNNRIFLSSLLELEGYDSIEAESGIKCISILKDHNISLVLLDYMMPEMSGIETLKIIRSKYSLLDLPVIMVTAKDRSEDISEALNAGANDYITKPVDTSVAIARISNNFELSRINRENKEREKRFKTLSDISFEGILIHNKDTILDVNQTLASMFKYHTSELVGQNLGKIFYEDNILDIEKKLSESMDKYISYNGIKSDETVFPVEIISREITYNGENAHVTAIKDITEKTQYEKIYNELQDNIERFDNLSSILPICSWCKDVKNETGEWQKAESFIKDKYTSSSGICPSCANKLTEENSATPLIEINLDSLTVKCNGKNIYLTLGEFNILNYLFENRTRVISIDELLERVLNYPPGTGNPDSIRTHIARLRSKLKTDEKSDIIVNIPRSGYKLEI